MRVIICGGRDYHLTTADLERLDRLHREHRFTVVVSGRQRGADRDGEAWAASSRIRVDPYPANWDRFGRAAGPIRNSAMAAVADAIILFPGGSGTADMREKARVRGLQVLWDAGR